MVLKKGHFLVTTEDVENVNLYYIFQNLLRARNICIYGISTSLVCNVSPQPRYFCWEDFHKTNPKQLEVVCTLAKRII